MRNCGVAPARNQGLQKSKGGYILILDDDTEILGNAIETMIRLMKIHPEVGVCGPKVVNSGGRLLYSCKRFPTLIAFIMNRFVKRPSEGSPSVLKNHLMLDWNHQKTEAVDYIIGACQLINRKALKVTGLYDDTIFYGPEDIDFCYRMWKNGWAVRYVPSAVVIHETQRLTKKNPFTLLGLRHYWSVLKMFQKYRYKDFLRITQLNDLNRDSHLLRSD
jgi:GT2 family glycosyltransferase